MPKVFISIICFTLCSLLFPQQSSALAAEEMPRIVINIPSRTLFFYEAGREAREYPIGIGRSDHETPLGVFKIVYKELNPTWIKPTKEGEQPVVIPTGPDNPLGYRWMEFAPTYGIHGTNAPDSIGGYVSNGCVRMLESDVEELYDKIPLGTPVEIVYERLLVKQEADRSVTLSIYPDMYEKQPLSVGMVHKQLASYGVESFIGRGEIEAALSSNAKTSIRIDRTFSLMVFGKQIQAKGFTKGGENYLPVVPLATEAKLAVSWDVATGLLMSPYGSAEGVVKNDLLYMKEKDVYNLYHLQTRWYPTPEVLYLDYNTV